MHVAVKFLRCTTIISRKHHHALVLSLLNVIYRLLINGSIALCGTYEDEGLNKKLKSTVNSAHRIVWSGRLLHAWTESEGAASSGSRKRQLEK